ncbi:MAG: phosphatidylinositol kinase [Alphaproteobacteria bacterium HGW-Alphaproteobacteria-5]|nr:MAG: phosphatidylinositol kinase [Alphaproteobacteria bacterium HGW-Alphaproteobacteria-5]
MVRVAKILFKGAPAGTLTETVSDGTRFTYAPEQTTSIACCLPVARREHEWPQGLHPFFQHLAPEGWLREKQARTADIAEGDDFGLLLRYGADCIGAVSIINDSANPPHAPVNTESVNQGRTVSGVQKKCLAVKDGNGFSPAGPDGPAPYIAKFNSASLTTLVRNEFLTLRWCAAVLGKSEVTEFQLAPVAGINEHALVVTRFDRTSSGEKLRLEDFAQILCKPREQDYSGKYKSSYEEVAQVISTHSSRPEIDLSKLFRRLIVFSLLGNCDGHLKNFSLLETGTGLRLSPLYDVVNSVIHEGYDQNLALPIDGRLVPFDGITRPLLEAFGREIGLSDRAIGQAFEYLTRQAKKAAPAIQPPDAEAPDGFVTRFNEIVSGACLRILTE